MQPMTNYKHGDILLLNFPYSEGNRKAKRPVLVLAQTDKEDIVVSKITTAGQRGNYDIIINDWNKVGLLYPSVIRIDKLATLSKSRVIKKLGCLSDSCSPKVKLKLKKLFNL